MKIIYLCVAALSLTSCARDLTILSPDHLSIKSSLQCDMLRDYDPVYKPKVEVGFDWDL